MSSLGVLEGNNNIMNTHLYPSLVCLFLIGVFSLSSCCSDNSAPDTKYLNQFHESNFSSKVTLIKSDDLFIDNNLMALFIKLKDEKENRIYEEVERKFKGFLKGYGIKNKVYLRRIVKRVVSKKVKILALY